MKRWQQWTRLGVMAVASFVLLVTVLPEVASGIGLGSLGSRLASSSSCSTGSSGSSGSGSSSGCSSGSGSGSGTGTVTGTVTVTGAPTGFVPTYSGAGACPSGGPPGVACANPVYSLANGGVYTLSLTTGTWTISGFYELNGFGGVFLSTPQTVTVVAGGTVTQNFTVAYQKPAAIKGTIKVTGVPAGLQIYSLSVLLCPSFAPYTGGTPSIACVNGYGQQPYPAVNPSPYQVTGLPPGTWTAYPEYCTEFGCATNAKAGKTVTLVAGHTTKVNLTTPFILPGEGLLNASVVVTGAPAGFTAPVAISACQVGGGSCQTSYYGFGGNTFNLLLGTGQWNVNGLYLVPPFDNAIAGPTTTVTIKGGVTTTVALSVPYQVLGTATGTIRVTGHRSHVPITAYTVVACPTGVQVSQACVSEFSGPGGYGFGTAAPRRVTTHAGARTSLNVYQLPTLTPGSWTLYPGYRTVFGSYSDPNGTVVNIAAGRTTTQRLKVPYQTPSEGVVLGRVAVIGVPTNGFQSGVQACSAPPTGTSCPNEQDAYNQSSDAYQLRLPPGTWWVSGFVELFSFGSVNKSTSQPKVVHVTAGSRTTANFAVRAGT